MELPVPEHIKKLWDLWDLRFSILFSLFLQACLVMFAPWRQRSRRTWLRTFLWSVYLMADWVAAVAIGLITKSQTDPLSTKGNGSIFAFWASFLLLHLGGPDSITSFSLEDNELWIRHLFGLLLQVIGAGYSLFLTIPNNQLLIPTIIVFFVGTIKYAERTVALYLASVDRFGATALPEPYPGHDYEEAVAIYSKTRSVKAPEQTELTIDANLGNYKKYNLAEEPDEMELLLTAYSLFEDFKGLIVDFLISTGDRNSSRQFFRGINPAVSFRLIEYELSLVYQLLHTKVAVVCSRAGLVVRFLSLCAMVGACLSFHYSVDKHKLEKFELNVTYVFLIGAIVLDIMSGIELVFSDWFLIALYHQSWKNHIPGLKPILRSRIWSKWVSWLKKMSSKSAPEQGEQTQSSRSVTLSKKMMLIRQKNIFQGKRWSGSVSQYNMIGYCLDARWIWNDRFPCFVRTMLGNMKILWFSTSEDIEDIKELIFRELKAKSSEAENPSDAKMVCFQRGESALLAASTDLLTTSTLLRTSSYIKLKWSINEFQYAESLLLWHLATELCYHDQKEKSSSEGNKGKSKRVCKLISDYVFYLLVLKPTMLAPVLGNWQIVFQDTFAEAQKYFSKYKISDHVAACNRLINVKTKFRPAAVKGIRSKSVLFDACILAQQLQHLEEDRWELMSKVWVELLSYGAINCKPIVHAQQPSRGGELLTFIWLLMNHLGLGSQFNEQEEQAGTKIVAVK